MRQSRITRKTFCTSMACAAVSVWLQGCGGGGGGYSSGGAATAPNSSCGASGSDISANHGHALVIPRADLDGAADKTYTLSPSTDGHVHSVTFTSAQLALLKAGTSVTVTSTTTAAGGLYGGTHNHAVTATVMVASCP